MAEIALDFGPPECAALALLGVLLVATIGSGNKLKALIAGAVGLLLATVGRDSFSGASRFTFDSLQLADGIDFVVVAMGLFGVGEILYNLEQRHGKTHVPAKVGMLVLLPVIQYARHQRAAASAPAKADDAETVGR
ncbi:MAG: tripartite tricarboxylate transporter permease [Mycobacterium sp.]|nr:tripartite tricarboxylate transporter permease [Mycobacterium sp.]